MYNWKIKYVTQSKIFKGTIKCTGGAFDRLFLAYLEMKPYAKRPMMNTHGRQW